MTLVEFLQYASGPGVNAVVGFVLAFALELVPGFDEVPPRPKRLLTMGLCFVVPLVATVGLYGLTANTDQVWFALSAGFLAFFGSQAGHATMIPATAVARDKDLLQRARLLSWRDRKAAELAKL